MLYTRSLLHHLRRVLGRNIYALRVKRKMPLDKLARLTGIPQGKLDRYEIGKDPFCFEHLIQIACAFDVQPDSLFRP